MNKLKHCAVTVSAHYLDKTQFSVKYLKVAYRADRTPIWHVLIVSSARGSFKEMEGMAKRVAQMDGVPYIEDVRHGERITDPQRALLVKYGYTVKHQTKRGALGL